MLFNIVVALSEYADAVRSFVKPTYFVYEGNFIIDKGVATIGLPTWSNATYAEKCFVVFQPKNRMLHESSQHPFDDSMGVTSEMVPAIHIPKEYIDIEAIK